MHKKNKNKNKNPKNTNPSPPQQLPADTFSEPEPAGDLEQVRVPEIPQVSEVNAEAGQTPAKPKRHRAGKKRKQNESKQENINVEEPITETTITKKTENLQESNKQEIKDFFSKQDSVSAPIFFAELPLIPAARKKKGKQSNLSENDDTIQPPLLKMKLETKKSTKEELTSEEEVPSENEQNTKYLNKSVEEPESKGEKKKNKKNKKSGDNFPNISEPAPEEACQASELYLCSDPTKESEINENRKAQEGNEIIFESKNNKHIISSIQTEDKIFSDCGKENKKNKKKKNSQSEEIKDCNKIGVIVEEKILEPVSEVSIDKYTDKIEMVDETRNKLNKSGKENKKTKSKEENKINENILEKHLKISATTESIELPTNFVLPAGPTPVVIEDDNNNFVNQGTRKPQKNQIKKIAKQVIEEDSNMHAPILQSSSVNTTDEENTIFPDSDCKIESSCKNNKMSKPNVGDLMCHLADKNISMALKKETCENTIDIHEPKISVYSLIKPEEQYKTEECILSVLDKVKPDKVKKDLKTDVPIQCDTHLKTVNPENIINMSCTLFDKSKSGTNNNDDFTTTHPIKKESSDLKDKVMEVNRDMEELQMSIEKSLAELTAMETDEIPELVAITEYKSSPTDTNKQEDITSINVETHMQAPPRNMSAKVTSIDNSKEEGTESFTEIELTNLQTVLTNIPQDFTDKNTIPVKQEKNKGKGKGHKQPTKIINLETSHTTSTSKLPMLQQNVTLASVDFTIPKGVILPEVVLAPEVHETMIEPFSCSQEHTNKGKGKNKKHKLVQSLQLVATSNAQTQSASTESTKSECADKKSSGGTQEALNKKNDSDKEKSATNDTKPATDDEHIGTGKETEYISQESNIKKQSENVTTNFVSIETFEDAMTTSFNDVLKKKEVISINMKEPDSTSTSFVIPIDSQDMLFDSKDSIKNKADDDKNKAENPVVTHPKNLLGHPDIPVTSNKNDYKKEKNKNVQTPNAKHARIKVKDAVDIAKESQTKINLSDSTCKEKEELSAESDSEEEYVYKYSFRKVFLANACHVCKSELKGPSQRVACGYCNLVFYCGQRHKDEDWPQHQALCFAVSTIAHLKGLKFIYGEAAGADGQEYRLLRMQAIVSCEKILKRKLSPCEQEALLYPRLCSAPGCREWRAAALADCAGCGLVSYCKERPEHLQPSHGTWCGSYRLYHRLVTHQQNKGRLEPALPAGSVGERDWRLPADMGQLLGRLYRRPPPGPDLDEAHYAALTQLATAPLTAAYSYQLFHTTEQAARGLAHSDDMALAQAALTLHVVGAELQFEADALNKWEVFFLHVQPALAHLRVVFVGPELNPSNLPLHLLANIKMCRECRQKNRKVTFEYHDGQLYHDYAAGDKFTRPDIVCAFNPGLHRSSGFGGVDSWPDTINAVLALGAPFCVTSYTRYELPRDLQRVRECARHPYAVRLQPTRNPFASLRPDRNFISDDEMPLIFKNYYIMLLSGAAGAAGTSTSHLS